MSRFRKPHGVETFPACPTCEGRCRLNAGTARETFCGTCHGAGRLHWTRIHHPEAFTGSARKGRGKKRGRR